MQLALEPRDQNQLDKVRGPPELEMGPLKSKMKTLGYPSRALKRKAAEAGLDDDGDGASPATAVPVVESPGTPVTPVNTPPAPV